MSGLCRKMKISGLGLLLVLTVLAVTLPRTAEAFSLDVTNNQPKTMSFVLLYHDDVAGKWVCRGWYNVASGATKTYQFKNAEQFRYAYLYAMAGDQVWDGSGYDDRRTRMVINGAFKYYDGQSCPEGANRRQVSLFRFDMCVNGAGLVWGEKTDAAPAAHTAERPQSQTGSPVTGITAQEMQAIALMNRDREKNGLSPLKPDEKLTKVARNHAMDMVRNDFFDHTNLKGQTPFDRLHANGISYTAAGENIAMNSSIAEMEEAWMNSPGHRANILHRQYTHVGLGLYTAADGSLYGVQVFARY